ncbi:MAG: BrnA antitoxin family protein [Pseudomonadales bacterium]|nr:BrnA antitoxin family protein [Pseudomonadales bacterium]
MTNLKNIPTFKTEQEERVFWESHDSSEYLDLSKALRAVLPNLKPSTKTISLRLPEGLLDNIKVEANKRDMPYQSLIKVWLAKKVQESRLL